MARAASGELTVMASGSPAAFGRADAVLAAIATKVYRLGDEPGIGASFKMVNQLLAGVHIAAACEAITFAKRLGLDIDKVFEVITASAGNSWMFENRVPHVLKGDYSALPARSTSSPRTSASLPIWGLAAKIPDPAGRERLATVPDDLGGRHGPRRRRIGGAAHRADDGTRPAHRIDQRRTDGSNGRPPARGRREGRNHDRARQSGNGRPTVPSDGHRSSRRDHAAPGARAERAYRAARRRRAHQFLHALLPDDRQPDGRIPLLLADRDHVDRHGHGDHHGRHRPFGGLRDGAVVARHRARLPVGPADRRLHPRRTGRPGCCSASSTAC